MNNIFVLDIDHTLVDTNLFYQAEKQIINQYKSTTPEEIAETIKSIKKDGKYTLDRLLAALVGTDAKEEAKQKIFELDFATLYYPDVISSIQQLKQYGRVSIFSQGEDELQQKKITPLVDKGLIDAADISIHYDKLNDTAVYFQRFTNDTVYFFDDHQHYLAAAKHANPMIQTVLVLTQETIDPNNADQPDIVADTFAQAVAKVLEQING